MSIAVIALVLSSCDKKQTVAPATTAPASTQTTVTGNPHARTGTGPVIKTQYAKFDRTGGTLSCPGKNGNCQEVVVKPNNVVVLTGLIDVIDNGTQEQIRSYFAANKTALSAYMPSDDIDFVISGDEIVTDQVNVGTKNHFILFNSATDLIYVAQINL